MTIPIKAPTNGDIMESVLLKGDIAKLTPDERVTYYNEVCKSMGLNPLTQPFAYITLNGKLQLYALRSCADQLRKINGVTLEIVSRDVADGILTVHVRARLPNGRADEELGAVSFPDTLRGEARANAELKCVTKAKRRATLSICGLGWLDETEVADIPATAKRAVTNGTVPHDAETGEIIPAPRVLKKDHRADYFAMLSELDNALDTDAWADDNNDRILALPPEWQVNIDKVIEAKAADRTLSSGEILSEQWSDQQARNLGNATRAHQSQELVPSAKLYTEMWDSAIETAKPEHRASLHQMWSNEKELRKRIEWTAAYPPDPLIERVKRAIESLKG